MSALSKYVTYSSFETKAFGTRGAWKCLLCNASGTDEPAKGLTAEQMAKAHFDKVRAHFKAVAFEPPANVKHDELYKWMKDELAMYGQMSPKDAAAICSQMANDFYRGEMRDRDEEIARLQGQSARS